MKSRIMKTVVLDGGVVPKGGAVVDDSGIWSDITDITNSATDSATDGATDGATSDFSPDELQEFLEADYLEVRADDKFKEDLRKKLWDMVDERYGRRSPKR